MKCLIINITANMYESFVIRFRKTNQIIILGLFHFNGPATVIATCIQYPFTVPLPGLADWFAFLAQIFPTM